MIPIVAERSAELESLCQRYSVLRLELFGSAATGEYRQADSDLDFLVEFQELPVMTYGAAYFGLLKSLEHLFWVLQGSGGQLQYQEPVSPGIG